jgi:hypothetical protein
MSDAVLEGAVYVLANQLHPDLCKIGFTSRLGGAADRASEYSKQHGFAGWYVFAEVASFFPKTVEARIHKELRRVNKHFPTVTDAREVFRLPPAEGKQIVEREIAVVRSRLPGDPSRAERLERELATALKNVEAWKTGYESWKQSAERWQQHAEKLKAGHESWKQSAEEWRQHTKALEEKLKAQERVHLEDNASLTDQRNKLVAEVEALKLQLTYCNHYDPDLSERLRDLIYERDKLSVEAMLLDPTSHENYDSDLDKKIRELVHERNRFEVQTVILGARLAFQLDYNPDLDKKVVELMHGRNRWEVEAVVLQARSTFYKGRNPHFYKKIGALVDERNEIAAEVEALELQSAFYEGRDPELYEKIGELTDERNNLEAETEDLERRLAFYENYGPNFDEKINKLTDERNNLESEIKDLERRLAFYENYDPDPAEMISKLTHERNKLWIEIEVSKVSHDPDVEKVVELRDRRDKLRDEIEALKIKLALHEYHEEGAKQLASMAVQLRKIADDCDNPDLVVKMARYLETFRPRDLAKTRRAKPLRDRALESGFDETCNAYLDNEDQIANLIRQLRTIADDFDLPEIAVMAEYVGKTRPEKLAKKGQASHISGARCNS